MSSKYQKYKNKIPLLSLSNGLELPEVPESLKKLTRLEERLCAPRIPFMQIRALGIDKQKGLRGQIVNIPISMDTALSVLPRNVSESQTILLKIKRKLAYDHDYMREIINIQNVLKAMEYLLETPLYKELNITLCNDWKRYFGCDSNLVKCVEIDDNDNICESDQIYEEERFLDPSSSCEIDNEFIAGCHETLLTNGQIYSLTIAPGEGKIPLSLIYDELAEELSFPTIHCGQKRKFKIKLTY